MVSGFPLSLIMATMLTNGCRILRSVNPCSIITHKTSTMDHCHSLLLEPVPDSVAINWSNLSVKGVTGHLLSVHSLVLDFKLHSCLTLFKKKLKLEAGSRTRSQTEAPLIGKSHLLIENLEV